MDQFLPGEIAVIVLRYLAASGCESTVFAMMEEMPLLKYYVPVQQPCISKTDYIQMLGKPSISPSLFDILSDYGSAKTLVTDLLKNRNQDGSFPLRQYDSLVTQLKKISIIFDAIKSDAQLPGRKVLINVGTNTDVPEVEEKAPSLNLSLTSDNGTQTITESENNSKNEQLGKACSKTATNNEGVLTDLFLDEKVEVYSRPALIPLVVNDSSHIRTTMEIEQSLSLIQHVNFKPKDPFTFENTPYKVHETEAQYQCKPNRMRNVKPIGTTMEENIFENVNSKKMPPLVPKKRIIPTTISKANSVFEKYHMRHSIMPEVQTDPNKVELPVLSQQWQKLSRPTPQSPEAISKSFQTATNLPFSLPLMENFPHVINAYDRKSPVKIIPQTTNNSDLKIFQVNKDFKSHTSSSSVGNILPSFTSTTHTYPSPKLRRLIRSAQKFKATSTQLAQSKRCFSTPRKRNPVRSISFTTPTCLKNLESTPIQMDTNGHNDLSILLPQKRKLQLLDETQYNSKKQLCSEETKTDKVLPFPDEPSSSKPMEKSASKLSENKGHKTNENQLKDHKVLKSQKVSSTSKELLNSRDEIFRMDSTQKQKLDNQCPPEITEEPASELSHKLSNQTSPSNEISVGEGSPEVTKQVPLIVVSSTENSPLNSLPLKCLPSSENTSPVSSSPSPSPSSSSANTSSESISHSKHLQNKLPLKSYSQLMEDLFGPETPEKETKPFKSKSKRSIKTKNIPKPSHPSEQVCQTPTSITTIKEDSYCLQIEDKKLDQKTPPMQDKQKPTGKTPAKTTPSTSTIPKRKGRTQRDAAAAQMVVHDAVPLGRAKTVSPKSPKKKVQQIKNIAPSPIISGHPFKSTEATPMKESKIAFSILPAPLGFPDPTPTKTMTPYVLSVSQPGSSFLETPMKTCIDLNSTSGSNRSIQEVYHCTPSKFIIHPATPGRNFFLDGNNHWHLELDNLPALLEESHNNITPLDLSSPLKSQQTSEKVIIPLVSVSKNKPKERGETEHFNNCKTVVAKMLNVTSNASIELCPAADSRKDQFQIPKGVPKKTSPQGGTIGKNSSARTFVSKEEKIPDKSLIISNFSNAPQDHQQSSTISSLASPTMRLHDFGGSQKLNQAGAKKLMTLVKIGQRIQNVQKVPSAVPKVPSVQLKAKPCGFRDLLNSVDLNNFLSNTVHYK